MNSDSNQIPSPQGTRGLTNAVDKETKLSERQREVLDDLSYGTGPYGDEWMRTMDVGGRDASHHSATLAQLVKKGLVESRRRADSIQGVFGSARAGKVYRITERGRGALSAAKEQSK